MPNFISNEASLLKRVINCTDCQDFREQPPSKFYPFSLYYSEINISSQKFMIIMQNPGLPKNYQKSSEYLDFKDNVTEDNYISYTRKYLVKWFLSKNKIFANNFFAILRKYKLITFDDLTQYLRTSFFDDFIVTDLVKCRKKTSEIDDNIRKTCGDKFLYNELILNNKINLTFSFSTRTWDYLSKFVIFPDTIMNKKVTNVHGMVFKCKLNDSFVIPLAHFSQTISNSFLRNSYYDYLEEGIQDYINKFKYTY